MKRKPEGFYAIDYGDFLDVQWDDGKRLQPLFVVSHDQAAGLVRLDEFLRGLNVQVVKSEREYRKLKKQLAERRKHAKEESHRPYDPELGQVARPGTDGLLPHVGAGNRPE